jgi:hypothetical protein
LFEDFREQMNTLLNKTITHARLVYLRQNDLAFLQFHPSGGDVAVQVAHGLYLYLGQTLKAVKENGQFRLRTIGYAYRVSVDQGRDNKNWLIRWEYVSREPSGPLHPRHHCHVNGKFHHSNRIGALQKVHIPSGWVTMEEVIRFLIHELDVKSSSPNWDKLLLESEETFRERTKRTI